MFLTHQLRKQDFVWAFFDARRAGNAGRVGALGRSLHFFRINLLRRRLRMRRQELTDAAHNHGGLGSFVPSAEGGDVRFDIGWQSEGKRHDVILYNTIVTIVSQPHPCDFAHVTSNAPKKLWNLLASGPAAPSTPGSLQPTLPVCHINHMQCYTGSIMSAQFLTIRLTEAESRLVTRLNKQTGLTKSALVKQALKAMSATHDTAAGGGLFELGAARFGLHGDATRQSAQIKRAVRDRLNAKRPG